MLSSFSLILKLVSLAGFILLTSNLKTFAQDFFELRQFIEDFKAGEMSCDLDGDGLVAGDDLSRFIDFMSRGGADNIRVFELHEYLEEASRLNSQGLGLDRFLAKRYPVLAERADYVLGKKRFYEISEEAQLAHLAEFRALALQDPSRAKLYVALEKKYGVERQLREMRGVPHSVSDEDYVAKLSDAEKQALRQRVQQRFKRRLSHDIKLDASSVAKADAGARWGQAAEQAAQAQVNQNLIEIALPGSDHKLQRLGHSYLSTYRSGGDQYYCPPRENSVTAPATVYLGGRYHSGGEVTPVCLTHLGIYNPETGARTDGNNGVLTGKYLETGVDTLSPTFSKLNRTNNDFRINPECWDNPGPDQEACVGGSQRELNVWGGEVQMYYDITDFRKSVLNDSFLYALGLNPEILTNIMHRQFRLGAPIYSEAKPVVRLEETFGTGGLSILQSNELEVKGVTRVDSGVYASMPPLGGQFASEAVVGDYANMIVNYVMGTDLGLPTEVGFANGSVFDTRSSIMPALGDALAAWSAYVWSGHEEVYQGFYSMAREREILLQTPVNCGVSEPVPNDTFYPCDRGVKLDNVMMFDEYVYFPWGQIRPEGPDGGDRYKAPKADGTFPFMKNPAMDPIDGPELADLAAFYFAAIFYDIANEAGLGNRKANMIFWKLFSLIDDSKRNDLSMREFGDLVLQAAAQLNMTDYLTDIAAVLRSRGIPLYGEDKFYDGFPAAVGTSGGLEKTETAILGFGTSHPDSQPNVVSYGFVSDYWNGYTMPGAGAQDYVAYQFMKHSKYGPCDYVALTDGTFDSNNVYQGDGTYYHEFTGRELSNRVVLAPGGHIRWLRYRKRCDNETEGYYAEDVRPLGFRVINALTNGFSIQVYEYAGWWGNKKKYDISVVDPSVSSAAEATYDIEIEMADGTLLEYDPFTIDQQLQVMIEKDEPFEIRITRDKAGQIDELRLRESVATFGRYNGQGLVTNLVPDQ